MAHFRAVIKGQRGEASRLGSKNSGINTRLQTWGYDVVVDAKCCDNETGKPDTNDWATIVIVRHDETRGKLIASVNLTTGQIVYHKVAEPYQPKTGEPCSCRPGIERDNCPACEGAGQRIDFAAIRARNTQR